MVEKKCLYCGKKYSATRVSSKYCSSRCRSAYFRENNRGQQRSYFAEYRLKNGINPRGMVVEHRKCLVCGKGFGITNEQLRKKYCSFGCYKSTLQYKFYKSKNGHYRRGCPKTSNDAVFSDWYKILKESDFKCIVCGNSKGIEVDMIVSISNGGLFVKENLQPLCGSCNKEKECLELGYNKNAKKKR